MLRSAHVRGETWFDRFAATVKTRKKWTKLLLSDLMKPWVRRNFSGIEDRKAIISQPGIDMQDDGGASSDTPRLSATETILRSLEITPPAEETAVAFAVATEEPETTVLNEAPEEPEVMQEEPQPALSPILSPFRLAQVGLGIVLIGLLMLLRYAQMLSQP